MGLAEGPGLLHDICPIRLTIDNDCKKKHVTNFSTRQIDAGGCMPICPKYPHKPKVGIYLMAADTHLNAPYGGENKGWSFGPGFFTFSANYRLHIDSSFYQTVT
jgi:hypothetical protein